MRAEIISIGDELTTGQRLDTNSQWLSQQLADLGIRVHYHTTIGDELDTNIEAFRVAMNRADIVISTGGLGPTADDLTRDAMAAVLGVELELHEPSLEHIRKLFARRARPMPETNMIQAKFPQGTKPIFNPYGTAPGIEARIGHSDERATLVFCLPGVPAEMKELWEGTVRPRLLALTGGARVLRSRVIRCFGVGESDLENMLPDLIRRGRSPTVGITVSQATISLRIVAEGKSEEECDALIQPTAETIYQCLGNLIFGEADDELEHAVLKMLQASGKTLAASECGTTGFLIQWLSAANVAGLPGFVGGIHTSCHTGNSSTPATIAGALAEECRKHFRADYGVALGPWPKNPGEEGAGLVGLAVVTPSGVHQRAVSTAGHPDLLQARAAKQALNFLRLTLGK